MVGTRRASWRIISSIEQKEESKGTDKHVGTIRDYRQKIETELERVCQDVLDVLDESLIPKAESGESKVFYHKMYVINAITTKLREGADGLCFTGRVTIIVISPSLRQGRSVKLQPLQPTRLTRWGKTNILSPSTDFYRMLRTSLKPSLLPLTQFVLVSHSTSRYSIMRS